MRDINGQQFGNYRLIHRLGGGGFADVYLGQHVRISNQQAAIKILHLTNVDEQLFQQEAERTSALRHTHIVRLYDFDIQQGIPFLVLDYAPNGSLASKHKGQRLPLSIIIEYVKQIACALQYAHDNNIIHRDIKPDNILVGLQDELLISDFGIAVISKTGYSSLQSSYNIGGTPYYMAPEAFRGKPEKASDQYSLGIMVYEWLCGKPPFTEGDFIQLGYQHTHEPAPALREMVPTLSQEIEQTIMRALAKDPHDRFLSVQEFARSLEEADKKPPVGTTLLTYKGHGDAWSTFAWSPDSKYLASGSYTGEVRVWNAITWELVHAWAEHDSCVNSVAWSSDGQRLASGSSDKTVHVWNVDTGEHLFSCTKHSDSVLAVIWSPDGSKLASVSSYFIMRAMLVQVWDAATGQHFFSSTAYSVDAVAWSPDGDRFATGTEDGKVVIQDIVTSQFSQVEQSGRIYSVVWSPDGHKLVSISIKRFSPIEMDIYYETVQIWDTNTWLCLFSQTGHSDSDDMSAVVWSPDGSKLAIRQENIVLVLDASTGQRLFPVIKHSGRVIDMIWLPDGNRLASCSMDGTVQIWDASIGHCLFSQAGYSDSMSTVAWSPDGRKLVSNSRGVAQIFDVITGYCLVSLKGYSDGVSTVAWSPDGGRLVSSSEETVQVWDVSTGKHLLTYTGHTEHDDEFTSGFQEFFAVVRSVVWSPDGCRLASFGSDGWGLDTTVQVWNATTGQRIITYTGHAAEVIAVTWSPDGHKLASSASSHFQKDTTVQVWDAATGKRFLTYAGHSAEVIAIAWSPDGNRLATGSADNTVQIWEVTTGKRLFTYAGHTDHVNELVWSQDGYRIYSSSADKTVQVWNADTGKRFYTFVEHSDRVTGLAWSPDRCLLAFGSANKTVEIWEVATNKQLFTYTGHLDKVNAVAWSPDGKMIASCSLDKTVRVWQAI
mgnify:CR=1 FL=1